MASRCGAAMAAGASGGLLLAALVAWACERDVLSFESASPSAEPSAWTASGERARIGIDRGTARHGAQSLRLEGEAPDAEARATIRLPLPSVEGNRLRITAAWGGADPLEQQQALRAALGWLARECRGPSGGGMPPKPADPSFGR